MNFLKLAAILSSVVIAVALFAGVPRATAYSVAPKDDSSGSSGSDAQTVPLLAFFVPVAIRGGTAVLKLAVKATSKKAAKKVAKKLAKSHGFKKPKPLQPVRGDFRTAGGYTIRVGMKMKKKDGYQNMRQFRDDWGPPGSGYHYHHIVEQNARKLSGHKFPRWKVHNRGNVVGIRAKIHTRCVNSYMNSKLKTLYEWERQRLGIRVTRGTANLTMRKSLEGYSFRNRHRFGLILLSMCGVHIDGL